MSREIDRQIAELMGWTVVSRLVLGVDSYILADPYGSYSNRGYETEIIAWQHVPQYSTDWSAMRLLVEWLQGKGFRVMVEYGDECEVEIFKRYPEFTHAITSADNAPLALCKAVLSLPPEVLA